MSLSDQKNVVSVGDKIGQQYKIHQLIGKGAWGEVYLAYCEKREIPVAIKILTLNASNSNPSFLEEYRSRFIREAKLAIKVRHPSIIHVYDYGNEDDIYWYAMEYIDGSRTLYDAIQDASSKKMFLSMQEIFFYFKCIVSGVRALHMVKSEHRDLKSKNILVYDTPEGPLAKILDLGVAHVEDSTITHTGMPLCTPTTVAPEYIKRIFDSTSPFDHRIDLFSLGVVLYEMLTGVLPFQGSRMEDVWIQIREHQPPYPSFFRPEISSGWDHIVLKCLEKDPEKRFYNASELYEALVSVDSLEIYHPSPIVKKRSLSDTELENISPLSLSNNQDAQNFSHLLQHQETNSRFKTLPHRYKIGILAIGSSCICFIVMLLSSCPKKEDINTHITLDKKFLEKKESVKITPKTLTDDAYKAKNYQLVNEEKQIDPEKEQEEKEVVYSKTYVKKEKKKPVILTNVLEKTQEETVLVKHYDVDKTEEDTSLTENGTSPQEARIIPTKTFVEAKLKTPVSEDSLDKTVTVSIGSPIKDTLGKIIVPSGTDIVGTVSFHHQEKKARCYIEFSRLLFKDGEEKAVTAVAASKDGRIGIQAYVPEKERNVASNIAESVVDVLQSGAEMLPIQRSTDRFLNDEREKARNQRENQYPPAELAKNTKIWVMFKQRVVL